MFSSVPNFCKERVIFFLIRPLFVSFRKYCFIPTKISWKCLTTIRVVFKFRVNSKFLQQKTNLEPGSFVALDNTPSKSVLLSFFFYWSNYCCWNCCFSIFSSLLSKLILVPAICLYLITPLLIAFMSRWQDANTVISSANADTFAERGPARGIPRWGGFAS